MLPIYSVGESNYHGNRLFKIIDTDTIIFKPDKQYHIQLNLEQVGKNRKKTLLKLIELQSMSCAPLTYELDLEYVYITYDYSLLKKHSYSVKANRTFQIDVNPNYVGWSVIDWVQDYNFKLIASGMFSLEQLNQYQNSLNIRSNSKEAKYITNKRRHEVIEIAKDLFKLCKHYHCEVFAMEDLSMKSSDLGKGQRLNKLINNQWNRNLLFQQIQKHTLASSTTLVTVQPQYSSIVGNLVNRNLQLPDPVLASIEIGRRGHAFSCQYIFKRRQQEKTVILPALETVKKSITQSLEELGIDAPEFNDWKELWSAVKKSRVKYRFPLLLEYKSSPFSKSYKRKRQIVYTF
jgi:ISCaje4 transposase tnpB